MISKNLEEIFSHVIEFASNEYHEYLTPEHLLFEVAKDSEGRHVLEACECDVDLLLKELEEFIKNNVPVWPATSVREPVVTLAFQRIMDGLATQIHYSGRMVAGPGDLILSIMNEKESYANYLLAKQDINQFDIKRYISHGITKSGETDDEFIENGEYEDGEEPIVRGDPLKSYATCLNEKAANNEIDPLIGRSKEIERAIIVMNRRRKNNLIFVGEPGVGKTAIVEGIALRIHQGKVPETLKDVKIYSIDMGAMIAGTRYRGDFEARLKATIKAIQKIPNSVMFIDEIHNIIGAGSSTSGTMDAANLLKPALSSGKIRCIGTTTFEEYKNIEKDRALLRRFEKIDLYEPDVKETYEILKGLKKLYEEFHNVKINNEALKEAANLSAKYIQDKFLPDKAIDVIDEAATIVKLNKDIEFKLVTKTEIEDAVARIAKIPAKQITESETDKLKNLETELKSVVFGQDKAIEAITRAVKIARAGMKSIDKPVGSFLFTGPTGVGKTEVAKQLAKILGINFIRFDMSEYMEKHAVSKFIGAPPGYVGFEQGGSLTDTIRKNPYSVLLLDEIEKAHEDIYNILLQIMDNATLTDNAGKKADFKNVILIMTSNAGAREMAKGSIGFAQSIHDAEWKGKTAIEKKFTPEFRNRLDSIITFAPLGIESIKLVVDKFINELNSQLKERNIYLKLDESARIWLAEKGYDPVLGARPIARLIQKKIKDNLADEILFGSLKDGGKAIITKKTESNELEITSETK